MAISLFCSAHAGGNAWHLAPPHLQRAANTELAGNAVLHQHVSGKDADDVDLFAVIEKLEGQGH